MIRVNNFFNNDDVKITDQKGGFKIVEYQRDLSVSPANAVTAYFSSKMNVRKRQLAIELDGKTGAILQAGAMQWSAGSVSSTTGIKGISDFAGKMLRGKVSGESAIKPEYEGSGLLVLEPTYKHLILIDMADWNNAIVLDDGLFLACESKIKHKLVARSNLSSAIAGGEGLFNLGLEGSGIVCVESYCPKEELITVDLQDDVLKIDGNLAIAWSTGLKFTTERSGKSLIGSAASGEGLVNVYRGTGRVLLAPISKEAMIG